MMDNWSLHVGTGRFYWDANRIVMLTFNVIAENHRGSERPQMESEDLWILGNRNSCFYVTEFIF